MTQHLKLDFGQNTNESHWTQPTLIGSMAETNYKTYAKHLIECYLERKDEKRVWKDAKSMFANEEEKDQMQIENEIRLTHRNE